MSTGTTFSGDTELHSAKSDDKAVPGQYVRKNSTSEDAFIAPGHLGLSTVEAFAMRSLFHTSHEGPRGDIIITSTVDQMARMSSKSA